MKTLKKTLCLVLAVVMAVGVLVIPANATTSFPDDADIEHDEAAAVLDGLGIMEGDDKGNFNPKETLTRAQAAKIIHFMLQTKEVALDYSGTVAKYTDVNEGDWFMSSVAYCDSQGIIGGNGDGTFKPNDPLTGAAFAKMLLVALGYDGATEGYGGAEWAINVENKARELGLNAGIDGFKYNAPLARDNAAQMAFNALFTPMVKYSTGLDIQLGDTSISQKGELTSAKNVIAKRYGLAEIDSNDVVTKSVVEGVITSNSAVADTDKTTIKDDTVEYKINTGADLYKHYVKMYVDGANVVALLDESTVKTTTKDVDGTSGKTWKDIFGADDIKLNTDNSALDVPGLTASTAEQGTKAPKGTYILDGKTIVAYIAPTTYYATSVTDIDKDGNVKLNNTSLGTSGKIEKDAYNAYDGMAKKDVVIAYTLDGGDIWTIEKAETVEGTIARIASNTNYTVGGNVYKKSSLAPANVNLASTLGLTVSDTAISGDFQNVYRFYLDKDGKHFAYKQITEEEVAEIYYLVDTYNVTEVDEFGTPDTTTYAQVIDLEGNVQTFTVKDESTAGRNSAKGSFITLTYNSKDKVYEIAKFETKPGEMTSSDPKGVANLEAGLTFKANTSRVDKGDVTENVNVYLTDSTLYVFVEDSLAKLDLEVVKGGVKISSSQAAKVLGHKDSDGNFFADVVVFGATYEVVDESADYLYVVATSSPAETPDGYEYTVYDGTTGEESTFIAENEEITQTGFYTYTTDEDGVSTFDARTESAKDKALVYGAVYDGRVGTLIRSTDGKLDDAEAADAVIVDVRDDIDDSDIAEITTLDDIHNAYLGNDENTYNVTMDVRLDSDGNVVIIFITGVEAVPVD